MGTSKKLNNYQKPDPCGAGLAEEAGGVEPHRVIHPTMYLSGTG